jgi:site-specific recombinase XerD
MTESNYKQQRKAHQPVINKFTAYLQTRHYGKDTVSADTNYLANYLAWLEQQQIHETEANYNDLLTFINHCTIEGNSKTLINRKLSAIRKYYDYLLYHGKTQKNPATGLFIRKKGTPSPPIYSRPKNSQPFMRITRL